MKGNNWDSWEEGRNGESREKRGMSGDWGQTTDANHFLSLSHKVESGKKGLTWRWKTLKRLSHSCGPLQIVSLFASVMSQYLVFGSCMFGGLLGATLMAIGHESPSPPSSPLPPPPPPPLPPPPRRRSVRGSGFRRHLVRVTVADQTLAPV